MATAESLSTPFVHTSSIPTPSVALALRRMLPTAGQTLLVRAALDHAEGAEAWAAWSAQYDLRTVMASDNGGLKGLLPLLAYALEKNGAQVAADDLSLLRMARYREHLRYERFQSILDDTLTTLTDGGASPLLLKGAALAATVYPQAELRHSHDIDLLIQPHNLPLATKLLLTQEFRAPQSGVSLDQAVARGDLSLTHASGLPVALHTQLFRNDFFAMSLDDAWQSAQQFGDSTSIRMLAPEWELVHILGTALCAPRRARVTWVCDAYFLIVAKPAMDWAQVSEISAESGLALATYPMLEYLEQQHYLLIPSFVFEQLRQKRVKAHYVVNEQALTHAHNQNAVTYEELFSAAVTWQERAWLLRWMLFPSLTASQSREAMGWRLPFFYLRRGLRYLKRQLISTKPSTGQV